MANIHENMSPLIKDHIAARLNHYIVIARNMEDFRAIWTYNLYTQVWRKQAVPEENHAPSHLNTKSCTVIGGRYITMDATNAMGVLFLMNSGN